MKKYAYIVNNMVHNILDEFSDNLPGIPFENRYTKEIVENCIECNDTVHEGMDYNFETGEFTEHIEKNIEEVAENENGESEESRII